MIVSYGISKGGHGGEGKRSVGYLKLRMLVDQINKYILYASVFVPAQNAREAIDLTVMPKFAA